MIRRLVPFGLALCLLACQTPNANTIRSVKPKTKVSAAPGPRASASKAPPSAASASPQTAVSASPSSGTGGGGTPSAGPSPVLALVAGTQTPDTWIAGPSLQRPRSGLGAASVGGRLLAVEGDHRPSLEVIDGDGAVWVLDTRHDGPMNPGAVGTLAIGISHLSIGVRGDKFVTGGGSVGGSTATLVLAYGKDGFLGAQGAFGTPVKAAAGGVIGDHFFLAGGVGSDATLTDDMQAYNVLNGDEDFRTAMPTAVAGAASAVVNGKLYVIGGYTVGETGLVPQKLVQVFDPSNNTWTTSAETGAGKPAPLETARHSGGAAVLGGKIYVAGGVGVGDAMLDSVAIYDPVTNTWATGASMSNPRALLGVAAHLDRLWAIGGVDAAGRVSTAVEVYRP